MAKITLSVPDNLHERIERYKDLLNLSEIFRICVSEELKKVESSEHRFAKGFPWREVRYKDYIVTVNARLGEYGPTDWSLEISSSKLGDKPLVVELGGTPWIDKIIKGVADYFNHQILRAQGIDLPKTLSRSILANLWLELGKLARRYNIAFSADVALLPPRTIRVRGKHGRSEFDDEVIPKDWGDVRKDEDQINVFFSNFWISSYPKTDGTVFRLSSYHAKQFKVVSAKTATRYVDFDPNDPSQAEEIRRIIDKASVVYLPNLSVKNVQSILFEKTDTSKNGPL